MSTTPSSHSSATARDATTNYSYDLSNAIYGAFPHCAIDISPRRSRAASPASASTSNSSKKRAGTATANTTGTANRTLCRQAISLHRENAPPTWLPAPNSTTTTNKRSALARRQQGQQGMNIHASTCLNLNASTEEDCSEADLWILPELDDWEEDETETESTILTPSSSAELDAGRPAAGGMENKWAGVLRRAANSNLERLRMRMEGEGWDFVKAANQDAEDLDEEFDVVICGKE
ncbi:uncharacterized protein J4E84_010407 [Alternaria hordeiaustralica]|uniref:uncharacterized protein n=1 Tax=Alternaria hordeiaustralica TaxID=1187925 RepID=UPI0020C4276A|nr:uncharacterized protein J4E84_010407 [Alternaria hordeiaustralica]KAI4674801.1 hypothetical protein J4E84_010407 [Alternaria hordeiaustralica]